MPTGWKYPTDKVTHYSTFTSDFLFIMSANFSREVMLGMLRQGATGDQILGILDAIVSDVRDENVQEQQELVSAS